MKICTFYPVFKTFKQLTLLAPNANLFCPKYDAGHIWA